VSYDWERIIRHTRSHSLLITNVLLDSLISDVLFHIALGAGIICISIQNNFTFVCGKENHLPLESYRRIQKLQWRTVVMLLKC